MPAITTKSKALLYILTKILCLILLNNLLTHFVPQNPASNSLPQITSQQFIRSVYDTASDCLLDRMFGYETLSLSKMPRQILIWTVLGTLTKMILGQFHETISVLWGVVAFFLAMVLLPEDGEDREGAEGDDVAEGVVEDDEEDGERDGEMLGMIVDAYLRELGYVAVREVVEEYLRELDYAVVQEEEQNDVVAKEEEDDMVVKEEDDMVVKEEDDDSGHVKCE
ncbi:MAG: hypothetical protein Q9162_005552 [Coniocarpon cinnabarinum]